MTTFDIISKLKNLRSQINEKLKNGDIDQLDWLRADYEKLQEGVDTVLGSVKGVNDNLDTQLNDWLDSQLQDFQKSLDEYEALLTKVVDPNSDYNRRIAKIQADAAKKAEKQADKMLEEHLKKEKAALARAKEVKKQVSKKGVIINDPSAQAFKKTQQKFQREQSKINKERNELINFLAGKDITSPKKGKHSASEFGIGSGFVSFKKPSIQQEYGYRSKNQFFYYGKNKKGGNVMINIPGFKNVQLNQVLKDYSKLQKEFDASFAKVLRSDLLLEQEKALITNEMLKTEEGIKILNAQLKRPGSKLNLARMNLSAGMGVFPVDGAYYNAAHAGGLYPKQIEGALKSSKGTLLHDQIVSALQSSFKNGSPADQARFIKQAIADGRGEVLAALGYGNVAFSAEGSKTVKQNLMKRINSENHYIQPRLNTKILSDEGRIVTRAHEYQLSAAEIKRLKAAGINYDPKTAIAFTASGFGRLGPRKGDNYGSVVQHASQRGTAVHKILEEIGKGKLKAADVAQLATLEGAQKILGKDTPEIRYELYEGGKLKPEWKTAFDTALAAINPKYTIATERSVGGLIDGSVYAGTIDRIYKQDQSRIIQDYKTHSGNYNPIEEFGQLVLNAYMHNLGTNSAKDRISQGEIFEFNAKTGAHSVRKYNLGSMEDQLNAIRAINVLKAEMTKHPDMDPDVFLRSVFKNKKLAKIKKLLPAPLQTAILDRIGPVQKLAVGDVSYLKVAGYGKKGTTFSFDESGKPRDSNRIFRNWKNNPEKAIRDFTQIINNPLIPAEYKNAIIGSLYNLKYHQNVDPKMKDQAALNRQFASDMLGAVKGLGTNYKTGFAGGQSIVRSFDSSLNWIASQVDTRDDIFSNEEKVEKLKYYMLNELSTKVAQTELHEFQEELESQKFENLKELEEYISTDSFTKKHGGLLKLIDSNSIRKSLIEDMVSGEESLKEFTPKNSRDNYGAQRGDIDWGDDTKFNAATAYKNLKQIPLFAKGTKGLGGAFREYFGLIDQIKDPAYTKDIESLTEQAREVLHTKILSYMSKEDMSDFRKLIFDEEEHGKGEKLWSVLLGNIAGSGLSDAEQKRAILLMQNQLFGRYRNLPFTQSQGLATFWNAQTIYGANPTAEQAKQIAFGQYLRSIDPSVDYTKETSPSVWYNHLMGLALAEYNKNPEAFEQKYGSYAVSHTKGFNAGRASGVLSDMDEDLNNALGGYKKEKTPARVAHYKIQDKNGITGTMLLNKGLLANEIYYNREKDAWEWDTSVLPVSEVIGGQKAQEVKQISDERVIASQKSKITLEPSQTSVAPTGGGGNGGPEKKKTREKKEIEKKTEAAKSKAYSSLIQDRSKDATDIDTSNPFDLSKYRSIVNTTYSLARGASEIENKLKDPNLSPEERQLLELELQYKQEKLEQYQAKQRDFDLVDINKKDEKDVREAAEKYDSYQRQKTELEATQKEKAEALKNYEKLATEYAKFYKERAKTDYNLQEEGLSELRQLELQTQRDLTDEQLSKTKDELDKLEKSGLLSKEDIDRINKQLTSETGLTDLHTAADAQDRSHKQQEQNSSEYEKLLARQYEYMATQQRAQNAYKQTGLTGRQRAAMEARYGYNQGMMGANQEKLEEAGAKLDPAEKERIDAQYAQEWQVKSMEIAAQKPANMFEQLTMSFKNYMRHWLSIGMMYQIMGKIKQAIGQVVQAANQLDKVMTNLRIVTNDNRKEAMELMRSYSNLGQQLAATTTEVASAANDWFNESRDQSKINSFNCWELSLRQSAAKPHIEEGSTTRAFARRIKWSEMGSPSKEGEDIVWTIW